MVLKSVSKLWTSTSQKRRKVSFILRSLCILTSHLFAERQKKFDVEELIHDVPSLKEISNAYQDADMVMPTKKNRHAALTNRNSIQHDTIMSLIPNKMGVTRNSTIDATRRA